MHRPKCSSAYLCPIIWVALAIICLSESAAFAADAIAIGAKINSSTNVYPASPAVVDVTKAPYRAKGNVTTDDTDAIQQAFFDVMGQHKFLCFPNGTYLVILTRSSPP